jgi:hypothetical protein
MHTLDELLAWLRDVYKRQTRPARRTIIEFYAETARKLAAEENPLLHELRAAAESLLLRWQEADQKRAQADPDDWPEQLRVVSSPPTRRRGRHAGPK